MGFGGLAVPAAEWYAVLIAHQLAAVVVEHGVTAFDIFEVAQNRAGRQAGAAGAEMPLQVADPEDEFGDGGGTRVEFEAEELMRVDGEACGFEALLPAADAVREIENFAFEALHVFQRHIEKIGAAAGGVEDANLAELVVEIVDFGECCGRLAFIGQK